MEIVGHSAFRLTRDADFELEEEEGGDLLEAIESVLRRRLRGATPVRLELDAASTEEVRTLLTRELALLPDEVFVVEGLLDPSALWSLYELDRPELKDDPWTPVTQPRLEGVEDYFEVISKGDLLVHHPYDSFETSVEAFIEQAAQDPDRPRDQARALPHVRGEPDRPRAGACRRGREAGRRTRRAPGALRRARQHHAGSHAGAGGRPRRLRHRGTEDARQGVPGRSPRGLRHPSLRARRHRQLQPEHRPPLRGRRPADRRPRARCRPERPVQPAHRLQPSADAIVACWSRPATSSRG